MAVAKPILVSNTSGRIVAFDISEEIYMRDYAEDFCEWVNGTVVQMSPVHDRHDLITQFLIMLFNAYFELRPVGKVRLAPFVMRLPDVPTRREPDIQLILNSNPHTLTPTFMDGPADLVVEIVLPESETRDYAEKFHQYEVGGVPEYWIIDPIKTQARFYFRNNDGAYELQTTDDVYESSALPGLKLPVSIFWQQPLPGPIAIGEMVTKMLRDG